MLKHESDDLVRELFDPDFPNVAAASFAGCQEFNGSLSREHIETNEIVGIRSVFLAPSADLEGLGVGGVITIGGVRYIAQVLQVRGRAITAVVLGS